MATANHECIWYVISIIFHLVSLIWCRILIWQVCYVVRERIWYIYSFFHLTCIRWMLTCPQRLVELLNGVLLAQGIIIQEQPEREVKHPTVSWEEWRDGGGVRLKTGFLNSARCSNPIFCQNGPLTDPQLKSLENCHPARTSTDV